VDNNDLANANKYHAQVTVAHAGIGGAADLADIKAVLVALQADLANLTTAVPRIEGSLRQLERKVDHMGEQLNRVEQMSAVVRLSFSSTERPCNIKIGIQPRYTSRDRHPLQDRALS
jgi:hypothetical protein